MHLLRGVVQHYDWGDQRAIPSFLGAEPDARPWAELWFGTHRGGPSLARMNDESVPLAELVGDLSFLVKVIAAAKPLSLQTHPTDEQAASGFREENSLGIPLDSPTRVYRDTSAKPELLVALGDFDAICGFRDVDDTLATCARFGWDELATHLRADGLAETVRWALTTGPKRIPDDLPAYAARLATMYPGSGAVLVTLCMHHVRLAAGEALFLGAGNVHAYLVGTGIEVMASSDNVVRAGFTTKHVDVDEFLAIGNFEPAPAPLMKPEPTGERIRDYRVPTPHFGVRALDIRGATTVTCEHAAEILVCTSGDAGALRRGQAAVLAGGERVQLDGEATVFRVWGNH